jgi:hypothetical protein
MNLPFFSQKKRQRQNGKNGKKNGKAANGKTANGDDLDIYVLLILVKL